MLGFATVDLSIPDRSLTVWLTSVRKGIEVGHTNAVCFDLEDETASRRAWGMTCDRYVILTDRTPPEHAALADWGARPCDLAMLAKQTMAGQESVMAAFAEHAAKPGKAGLAEPVLLPVPPPLDQAALDPAPRQLTLAVANHVMRLWSGWLTAERERVRRWTYMPGGRKDEAPNLLPADFTLRNVIQPVRAWKP